MPYNLFVLMKLSTFKMLLTIMSGIMILNFIYVYISFKDQSISQKLSDWSDFASYISGTTGIITSLMSLLITVYIAYFLTDLENKRNETNRSSDNTRFIRQLKEDQYSKISELLDSVLIVMTYKEKEKATDQIFYVRMQFVNFFKNKRHLFPDLNPSDFSDIDTCLIKLLEKSKLVTEVDDKTVLPLVEQYQNAVAKFHIELQNSILGTKKAH